MGKKQLADAYILGIPFGLFGAHHFYLGRKFFGILYLCTLGLFGIGYIYDLIRMRWLVRHANRYGNERKMITDCYLLGSIGGMFGIHHYYLGNWKLGLLYTLTLGNLGIGWIVDLFRMPKIIRNNADTQTRSVLTAYIMAAPPFGLIGAHHYYLKNYCLGITYTCTIGKFGVGWIVDLLTMKYLVKPSDTGDRVIEKITAYVLCFSPFGLFGAHHFYLKRYLNGGFYVATFGLFGVGWIFDMLRLPVLYERFASDDKHKYADEAYVFWFPFGLFGLHRFYMGKTKWGILYALTFGCLGFGWLIDGFRLPRMIDDFNKTVKKSDLVEFRVCDLNCKFCSVFKCRHCCADLFTFCSRCGSGKLCNKTQKSDGNKNEVAENDERRAMYETDDSPRLSHKANPNMARNDIVPVCRQNGDAGEAEHDGFSGGNIDSAPPHASQQYDSMSESVD